jgi:hypothetical protein
MAELTATGVAARHDGAARFALRSGAAWTLSCAAMLLVLAAPAIWNGFPIIFPDTGGYLERPLLGTLDLGRSALYGVFLLAGSPLAFWPNVVAQAAIVIWVITLTLRVLGFGGRPWLALGIVTMLSVATSLSWTASQLIPDVLFPAAVLALSLLAFQFAALGRWERLALAGIVIFAITSHMAAAALCAGLLAALWLLSRIPALALPKLRLHYAAAAVALGILLCPVSNLAITGSFAFTPGGSSFLFGRLVEDGILDRYLEDRCPDPRVVLCDYLDDMPDTADEWLWDPDSPYAELGGWKKLAGMERDIALDTLRRYPLMHLEAAADEIFEQLTSFATEVSLEDNEPAIEAIRKWTPRWFAQFENARQQRDRVDVDALNDLHVPVAALAMAGLLFCVIFRRRLGWSAQLGALGITIVLALCINAAVCGVFSHAVDRYQSRLAPLTLLAVVLFVIERWRRLPPGASASRSP